MRVRVLLFAALREAVGEKSLELELRDSATVADLLAQLEAKHRVFVGHRGRLLVARNEERAAPSAVLRDGDEVALLPPVSGGAEREWIDAAPLSLDALLREVGGPEMGGAVTFTGIVRNNARGEAIDHLEYEAYAPMAEKEMRKIVDAVHERWPHVRIAISHRVGRLAIGDAAVMIAAAAPHRAEAFEACRFAIDRLKATVPIWKKEFATSGSYWVEENP
ncbi:MAG TPA: molybdopterin converting factor subunit 1 [Myxococcota bacterium]|nr:molybdopterin converting factor subunit 1 [Myxococcota bacterium]